MAGESCRDRLSAASTATAPSPAGLRRLRQVSLPRTPATPNTLTSPHTHQDTASSFPRQRKSGPVPTDAVGGLNGSPSQPAAGHHVAPSPGACSRGGLGRGRRPAHPTIHQVHPAIQVPPRPRSCSTADTGFLLHHHSRAPPAAPRRKPTLVSYGPPAAAVGPGPVAVWNGCPRRCTLRAAVCGASHTDWRIRRRCRLWRRVRGGRSGSCRWTVIYSWSRDF